MYGVNNAIADMVRQEFGEASWQEVKRAAGVDVEVFSSMSEYPDEVTCALVASISERLGEPSERVLQTMGRYLMARTRESCEGLLDMSGGGLQEVLHNLDHVHARAWLSFSHLAPPSFSCEDVGPGDVRLHYYSDRTGLAHMLVGMLRGLGERFQTELEIELESSKAQGAPHDIFRLRWPSG